MSPGDLEARLRSLPRDAAPDPGRLLDAFAREREAAADSSSAASRHTLVWALLLAAVAVSGSFLPSSAANDDATLGLARLGSDFSVQLLQTLRSE